MTTSAQILEIPADAKKLVCEYRNLTGKPLGMTGEDVEYEVTRILGLALTSAARWLRQNRK